MSMRSIPGPDMPAEEQAPEQAPDARDMRLSMSSLVDDDLRFHSVPRTFQ